MKKIIKLLICFVVSFICYSLIISAEEVPEVPEVPETDDDNETIITLPRKYSTDEEDVKTTLTLNPDDSFKLEMFNLEGVIIATVQGTYKTIEENIVELYAPTKDDLFDTIELFEDTKTWEFYYPEDIPPIVDEPLEEQPNLDENGEIIEDEEGYVKSFLSQFFEENVVSAIIRIILNLGIDVGTVVAVILFLKKITDKYNASKLTLDLANSSSNEQTNKVKKLVDEQLPIILNEISENKTEIIDMINQGKELYDQIKTSTEETIEKNIAKVKEFNDNIEARTVILEEGIDMVVEMFKIIYVNNPNFVKDGQAEAIANMVKQYEEQKKN